MFNVERRAFWWKEVNIDSSTFPLGFSHLLTPTVQPLPEQGIYSQVPVLTEQKDFLSTRGMFLNTDHTRCSSVHWLPVERVEELLLPSHEKCFSITQTQTEY